MLKGIALFVTVAILSMVFFVTCDMTGPSNDPVDLQIQPQNPTVVQNIYFQLYSYLIYSDGSQVDVTTETDWTVSPSNFGYIEPSGRFRGASNGTCFLIAEYEEFTDTTFILIADLEQLILEPSEFYIPPEQSLALHCYAYVEFMNQLFDTLDFTGQVGYFSDDPDIAEVSAYGVVTGKAIGNTTIHASTSYAISNAAVHVAELSGFAIDTPSGTICSPGDMLQLTATAYYGDEEQDVTDQCLWQSGNTAVMDFTSPDSPGLLYVISEGEADIQATYAEVSSEPLSLASKLLESLEINPVDATIGAYEQVQYEATGHYPDGSQNTLTSQVEWISSNPDVAIISNSGVATSVDSGSCSITAWKNALQSDAANLNVTGGGWFENYDYGLIHAWDESGNWFIDNGEYICKNTYYGRAYSFNTDSEFSNVELEVELKTLGDGGYYPSYYYDCGVVFRKVLGQDHYYYVWVFPLGYYEIGYVFGTGSYGTTTLSSGSSEAINTEPDAWNHVRVEAVGYTIALYINEEFIVSVTNTMLTDGYVGLNIAPSAGVEYRFDNLKVTPIQTLSEPNRVPIPTPGVPDQYDNNAFTQ